MESCVLGTSGVECISMDFVNSAGWAHHLGLALGGKLTLLNSMLNRSEAAFARFSQDPAVMTSVVVDRGLRPNSHPSLS